MDLQKIDKTGLSKRTFWVLLLITSVFLAETTFGQQQKDRSWSVYKADAVSSNYSPLDQINVSNVGKLKPAWTLAIKDNATGTRPSQCNPIIVDGIMYATSASQRAYAVDAATGKQLWSFDPFNGKTFIQFS